MEEPLHLVEPADLDLASAGAVSFEAFFLAERDDLFGAMALVTHDRGEAEELTQEAFVKVLERWDRVGGMDDPAGYLYRTAMNLFRKRYRRASVAARRSIGLPPPRDPIEDVDARDAAARALAPLTARQRAAIVLTDLLGFSSEEAARALGVRASTVRMHASVARAALRKTLGEER
ncbi:MAG: sigma-70 family RNA polymerase sigma factor [Actinobacteria bacterium]|nr:sigma-70 family RNA polymerase sigma factor [Actinomycetota bacterium]